jgi:competence protein ComEC
MKVIALGFLLGVLLLQQLTALPSVGFAWLLLIAIPLTIMYRRWRLPLAAVCGFLWALLQAHSVLHPGLDPALEGKDLAVVGSIVSIPESRGYFTRFLFDVERVDIDFAADRSIPERVRLNWYGPTPELRLGQRWRLVVRLKRPWGFMNPGGFDYEGWLFSQGIRATGYVREATTARRLPDSVLERPIGRLRQAIAHAIDQRLGDSPNAGIITALAIGERGDLDQTRWQLLLVTGTNHLLAISGLNIGLVAGLVYFLALYLWRMVGRLCLWLPAPQAASIIGLVAGTVYAALAGFSIPTQRAVIMLAVVMGALILNRIARPGHTLAVALLAVLVWSSTAVLSVGFWLSFAAVAIILYSLRGRPVLRRRWWQGIRLQWMLALGLAPLTLLFFQRSSLISPLANLIAVPWVGLLVGPMILVAVALLPIAPPLARGLLVLSDGCLELLWRALEWLAVLPFSEWHHAPPAWALVPAAWGVIWLLAPRGWPARWLGGVLLAPLALAAAERLDPGSYRVTLLDVGQGLSAVVETRNHTLVYDTGPRFSDAFNAGDAVVLPFLRHLNIKRVDTLLISHGDDDHAGGAQAVLDGFPVRRVLTSAPNELAHERVAGCRAGQRWRWDGVDFEILYPADGEPGSSNDRSCVLRVASSGGAVLFPGDIEADGEASLLRTPAKLPADVLVVPHHGSDTSSSEDFIRAVQPQLALIPAGYGNRYGFPASAVVARYRRHAIPLIDTGAQGALILTVHPATGVRLAPGYRQSARRYWTSLP